MPDADKSIKAVPSKFLMTGLALKWRGLRNFFSSIAPITLIIGSKIHTPPCQVLSAGFITSASPPTFCSALCC